MTLLDFFKLILSNKKWIFGLPLAVAIAVFALTLNSPKEYVSEGMLYTGVVPTSDGTVGGPVRVDVFAVNNAIDNIQTIILSRQVLEETSLHMLARHLAKRSANRKSVEASLLKFLDEHEDRLKSIPLSAKEDELFKTLMQRAHTPEIRWLLEDETSQYGIAAIATGLKIKRSGSSDLLAVTFTSSEASVAQETLGFLIEVFTKRFREMRKSEAGSMVQFFEREVAKAADRLSKCAEEMRLFQMKNRIINYYEQTHLVAIETEHLNGQYYDEMMKLAASEQAFQDLRAKLGVSYQQALSSEEIVQAQQSISQLMTRKQLIDASSAEYKTINDAIGKSEEALRKSISQLYVDGRTEEGVSKKDILKQWLDQFIALSEARARVVVMDQRKTKQEKQYDFFAPLGSVLHNFERQMDVAEREYLDLLHSLNQARLRQQSVETSTMLATVDKPSLPLKPKPSKRKLLVIAGWLGSLFMVMGVILFLEYFDSTMQSPEKAVVKTGLTVLGVTARHESGALGLLAWSNLLLRFFVYCFPHADARPRNVLVVAKSGGSSSADFGAHLAGELIARDYKVLLTREKGGIQSDGASLIAVQEDHTGVDFVLTTLPSVDDIPSAWKLMSAVEEVIVVASGEQSWNAADEQAMVLLEKITGKKPYLVLTGIEERRLEYWLGEVPKERSNTRKLIKKIIQFQFS